MKVTHADIVISAVSRQQYPSDKLPELVIAGRSNVGKSSFINQLIQRKSLARTSSKPGKTQTLNFYKINNIFYFVDAPGYGYAKVSKKERDRWGAIMEEYFSTRESLKACLLIVDVRHEPTDQDVMMYDYIKYFDLPVIIVATKIDKIAKGKRDKHLKQTVQVIDPDPEDVVIPFSAETGEGKNDIWQQIKTYINE